MSRQSPFSEEWRRCLKEHYMFVIRERDEVTRPTLEQVLLRTGIREEELRQWRIEATMHVDDVGEDYVPDMDILSPEARETPEERAWQPHPAECSCPECMAVNEDMHDADGQPITPDPEAENYEGGHIFHIEDALHKDEEPLEEAEETLEGDDEDNPQQLSLF